MSRSKAGSEVIDVGQVLDKYELLERVGQGGMAIVYRGLDRSLQREVAIKVLHRHLSEHQEARDRFEREAHAVAKLRHENILEIFAYSGKTSDESYIVTEYIAGQTLKQFITDHPPQYPEIGAMVVTQICRALAHAHAQGILHRDVKPENVMIRSDGVVKLMDFGISQMIDTQRLTVTGQLLGSPAYMSPEHVEGAPLDFRTDVFAAGIVLYQLTVGKLPFEGKNPHEILKRIAECKFPDPRHANPRTGNELGRIILRAMARDPDDRYRDMGEMLSALEKYLDGSGLGGVKDELSRFFKSPASYEMALKARLCDHLLRRARDYLHSNHAIALELLDRILAIDPTNAPVAEIMKKLGRRRREVTIAFIAGAIVLAGGGAWAVRRVVSSDGGAAPDAMRVAIVVPDAEEMIARPIDAGQPDAIRIVDARESVEDARKQAGTGTGTGTGSAKKHLDAGEEIDAGTDAIVHVQVSPPDSEVQIGNSGEWIKPIDGVVNVRVGAAGVLVSARNECCESKELRVSVGDKDPALTLGLLPGRIVPHCAKAGVTVTVDGGRAALDQPAVIPFGETTQTRKTVVVEFTSDTIDTQKVTVKYNETKDVTCAFE